MNNNNRSNENCWQVKKSVLQCNQYMFENKLCVDVVFEVCFPDQPNIEIAAHKFVLVSRSPVFEAMFCGDMIESVNDLKTSIKITDIDAEAFRETLRFMYCESANLSFQNVCSILYASKKYFLPELTERCKIFLEENLEVENVLTILDQSLMYDVSELVSKCIDYICPRTHTIFKSDSFLNLSKHALKEIVKCDKLYVENEIWLLEQCIRWAQFQIQNEIETEKSLVLNNPVSIASTNSIMNKYNSALSKSNEKIAIANNFTSNNKSFKYRLGDNIGNLKDENDSQSKEVTIINFPNNKINENIVQRNIETNMTSIVSENSKDDGAEASKSLIRKRLSKLHLVTGNNIHSKGLVILTTPPSPSLTSQSFGFQHMSNNSTMVANLEISPSDAQTLDETTLRLKLGDILKHIRFSSMDPMEFAQSLGRRNILSDAEKAHIYFKILTQEVPKGYIFESRDRVKICSRFASTGTAQQWWSCNGPVDAITFETDSNITLLGISLYGGKVATQHKISIKVYDQTDLSITPTIDPISSLDYQMDSDGSSHPCPIFLQEAVNILVPRRYTIVVTLKGSLTQYGNNGREVVKAKGVTFTFLSAIQSTNGTNVKSGQIPQLIFL